MRRRRKSIIRRRIHRSCTRTTSYARVAGLNMYMQSGQTKVRRMIAFRDRPPCGEGSGMPCGACREFFYQLNEENEDMEILVDYAKRETVTLRELLPKWWGAERYEQAR